ncbi:hypothetical protein BH10CHL1_BH10CHL1_17980 [soil metagenome]
MSRETKEASTQHNGRFKKGNPGGPGRPKKAAELAMLNAIKSTFTDEQIKGYLKQAMETAVEQKSSRGMIAVLEYIADRTLGKPVQQITTGETDAMREALDELARQDEEAEANRKQPKKST